MGVKLYLLLCAAALTVSGKDESSEGNRWSSQSLPVLFDRHTELLNKPLFRWQKEDEEEEGGSTQTLCGIECQRSLPHLDQREQERILGYETLYDNGTCTHTDVTLRGFNGTSVAAHASAQTRRKRQVYGTDGRFVISDSHFITSYPFSTAVRLSTGCSGVLVSPKHVLTAAHCLHDGRRYLESAGKVKVGVLQLKTKRTRAGRRRGGRQRGGNKEEEGTGERTREVMEDGEEQNSLDGDVMRGRQGGRRRMVRKEDDGKNELERRRVKQRRAGGQRIRRSAEPRRKPVFRWSRVKQTHIPQGWILSKGSTNSVAPDYDYALLELKRPVKQQHMELGVAPSSTPLARIHFSGYDSDGSLLDGRGDEKVVYRFCSVAKESDDLMYQHCDAQQGATGAGVYIRLRRDVEDPGRRGKWQRRVIGVFTGHQWVEVEEGKQRDFNTAVRITPPKYAQICHWIHGDPRHCKDV